MVRPAPTACTLSTKAFFLAGCGVALRGGAKRQRKRFVRFNSSPQSLPCCTLPCHNKPLFAPSVVLTGAASFHLEMSTCTSFATLFCLFNRTSLFIIKYYLLKIYGAFSFGEWKPWLMKVTALKKMIGRTIRKGWSAETGRTAGTGSDSLDSCSVHCSTEPSVGVHCRTVSW